MKTNLNLNKVQNRNRIQNQQKQHAQISNHSQKPEFKSIYDLNNKISFASNIISVANRVPPINARHYEETGKFVANDAAGGQLQALKGAGVNQMIGWNGLSQIVNPTKELIINGSNDKKIKVSYVDMDVHKKDMFYGTVSNGKLWPVFHMIKDHFAEEDVYGQSVLKDEDILKETGKTFDQCWETYKEVNKEFAKKALRALKTNKEDPDGNVIWIQDYQMLMVPQYVREGLKEKTNTKAKIGYFHHIPFPKPTIFVDQLGKEKTEEMMHSLLQNDLIGFHVKDYANNFMDTLNAMKMPEIKKINREEGIIETTNGREVKVKSIPISIDFEAENKEAQKPEVEAAMKELKGKFNRNNQNHKYMVFNIERADFTKNLLRRVDSIRQFLVETTPRVHNKFTFVIAASPSRTGVASYDNHFKELKRKIEDLNDDFERKEGYSPIIFKDKGVFGAERLAMFRLTDAMIVNPISDGMNLVPKELAAIKQKGDSPYKIILSSTPGIAKDPVFKKNCTMIDDPLSIDETVAKMTEALQELTYDPDKLKEENAEIRASVKKNNVQKWADTYLKELNKCGKDVDHEKDIKEAQEERMDNIDPDAALEA